MKTVIYLALAVFGTLSKRRCDKYGDVIRLVFNLNCDFAFPTAT
jgi:hypothetical protein